MKRFRLIPDCFNLHDNQIKLLVIASVGNAVGIKLYPILSKQPKPYPNLL